MIHKGLYAYNGKIGPLMLVHELEPDGHFVKIYALQHYKKNANYILIITYGSKPVCKNNITYGLYSYVTFGTIK